MSKTILNMSKTILITGSTDGIGLATAKILLPEGHHIIIHGRIAEKVENTLDLLKALDSEARVDGVIGDLSSLGQVRKLAKEVINRFERIDVLINNAGVLTAKDVITEDGLELRFAVNTVAPYLLTKLLLPIISDNGRIINLSSAAQAKVDINALKKGRRMDDQSAYAQSKLAITMWTIAVAEEFIKEGRNTVIVAVNPKSFLGSKMVKEAYGRVGYDIRIGADILVRAALSNEFANASGKYFDNDYGMFTNPHPDALNKEIRDEVVTVIDGHL